MDVSDSGRCLKVEESDSKMAVVARRSDGAWLMVANDFGCVLFEAKV